MGSFKSVVQFNT